MINLVEETLICNIQECLVNKITESKLFSMQLDGSINVGGKSYLLAYIRVIEEDEITKDFLCKNLK